MGALSERDETAEICRDADGNPEPDSELRDHENIPLKDDIHDYFDREVKPYVADAWIDEKRPRWARDSLDAALLQIHAAEAVRGDPE